MSNDHGMTKEEALALIEQAKQTGPIKFWRVGGTEEPMIWGDIAARWITESSEVTSGLLTYRKDPQIGTCYAVSLVEGSGGRAFINFWHAFAYSIRRKDKRI